MLQAQLHEKIAEATSPKDLPPKEVVNVEEDTAIPAPDTEFQDSFRKLEAKDKEVRAQNKLLAEKTEELRALKLKADKLDYLAELQSQDPYRFISELGLEPDQLSQYVELRKSKDPELIQLKGEIADFKRQVELDKRESLLRRQEEDRRRLHAVVETAATEGGFDIIVDLGLCSDVVSVMESHYDSHKKIMSPEEACKIVCDSVLGKFEKVKGSNYLKKLAEKSSEGGDSPVSELLKSSREEVLPAVPVKENLHFALPNSDTEIMRKGLEFLRRVSKK